MENKSLTLGSLFDGSGGFPLAGTMVGIRPVWNSEIEPFPIRVTEKRMPGVRHYGDVSKLSGADLPPVDIITFGSPCQDMSLAGRREGLDGKRSGLFFDAVRIIKEMRCKTNGKYPGYAVWENVPGAFSSNHGEDFRAVLEELIRIADASASVPVCKKWNQCGLVLGDGFSVAWRMLDAQYWGVPQRRRRIYLVSDFNDERAGEILFESEGLSRYSAESFKAWQKAAGNSEISTGETGGSLNEMALLFENHLSDARYRGPRSVGDTVTARYGTGGNNQPLVLNKKRTYHSTKASFHTKFSDSDAADTLVATDYKDPPTVSEEPEYIVRRLTPVECARLQGFPDWWCDGLGDENPSEDEIRKWDLIFKEHDQAVGKTGKAKSRNQIIRWLKDPYTDSAAYRMWGNGICLSNAFFVLSGIAWNEEKAFK